MKAQPVEREHELLCLTARTELDAGAEGRLSRLVGGGLDWELLWEQGDLHEVLSLVTRTLERLSAAEAPPGWLERGERRRLATLLRNRTLADEHARVVGVFRDAGVEAIPVKGVVLAEKVYGDLSLRPALDLDVLVRGGDLPKARVVLAGLGYAQRAEVSFKAITHAFHDPAYFRQVGDLAVRLELHQDLWARQQFQPCPELWSRSVETELRGTPVRVLSPEDTLLHQAIHRTRSALRLRFLCDVAEVVRRHEERLDWELVVALARSASAGTALFVALSLARRLLGAPVPARVEDALRPGRTKRLLLDATCGTAAMFRPSPPGELAQQPHLALRILEQDGAGRVALNVTRTLVRKGRERLYERRRQSAAATRAPRRAGGSPA